MPQSEVIKELNQLAEEAAGARQVHVSEGWHTHLDVLGMVSRLARLTAEIAEVQEPPGVILPGWTDGHVASSDSWCGFQAGNGDQDDSTYRTMTCTKPVGHEGPHGQTTDISGLKNTPVVELLTYDEHEALRFSGALANMIKKCIGTGPTAEQDWAEAALLIHQVQHFIMAQAAARAYPSRYRLAGGVIA